MPKRQTNNFKHRVEVHGDVEVTNELNETTKVFQKIKSVYAAIIPQTGNMQKQVADTILTNVTHKIIVRYASSKFISKDMKLCFRGHWFEIKYIMNPYFKNDTLEIFCTEVMT